MLAMSRRDHLDVIYTIMLFESDENKCEIPPFNVRIRDNISMFCGIMIYENKCMLEHC